MRKLQNERFRIRGLLLGFLAGSCVASTAWGQVTIPAPATDSSAQASPIKDAPKVPAVDASAEASPIPATPLDCRPVIAAKTAIPLTLDEAIDSGRVKNGQTVLGALSAPVGKLPAGTAVALTVVATVPAGKVNAVGEFSLQVVRVGKSEVYTDTQTFRGKPGHKDVADAAPAIGTDAGLPKGAPLTFHVLPQPAPANGPPAKADGKVPGSVDGVASGLAPPPGNAPASGGNNPGQSTQSVQPGNTTSVPIQPARGTVPQ
jgi:hypothetical protein